MNKNFIRIFGIFLTILIFFTGCDSSFKSAENLIHPPHLSGMEGELQNAFESAVKDKGTVVLKSPLDGKYRSAYTLFDLNADNVNEAIVFYSLQDDTLVVYMNILKYSKGKWESIADIKGEGTDIYSLEFSDLNKDNQYEILASFNILDSKNNKNLCVYLHNESTYTLNATEPFTSMYIVDIDNDNQDEIGLAYLNSTADDYTSDIRFLKFDKNFSYLYTSNKTDLYSENSGFLSINSDKRKGISYLYIDEIVGTSSVTEIIYFDKKTSKLVKPIDFDITTFNKCPTSRNVIVSCDDVDNDTYIEIPSTKQLPDSKIISRYDKNSILNVNLVLLNNFVDGNFVTKKEYIRNSTDGYILELPNELIIDLSVIFDSDNHIAYFYSNRKDESYNQLLFTLKAYNHSNYEGKFEGVFLKSGSVYSYYCEIFDEDKHFNLDYKLISKALIASDSY